jgi:membrane protein
MRAMWRRAGVSWRRLLVRVVREMLDAQLSGQCAQLAFFFLLSLLPLLLFLSTLLGYLAGGPESRLHHVLFLYLGRIFPSTEVTAFVQNTLRQVVAGRGGLRLSLSLLAALWVASDGMLAAGRTLTSVASLEERRPWWQRRLVAVALTIAFAVIVVCALTVLFVGHSIGVALADAFGNRPAFLLIWHVLRWPVALVFVVLSFDAIYNFAPDWGPRARRPWGSPGAVVGVAVWVVVSFGFHLYLAEVRSYALTYGSLAVVIVLMLWFYLTGFAILVGGEINAVIARHVPALHPRGAASAGGAGGGADRGRGNGANGAEGQAPAGGRRRRRLRRRPARPH